MRHLHPLLLLAAIVAALSFASAPTDALSPSAIDASVIPLTIEWKQPKQDLKKKYETSNLVQLGVVLEDHLVVTSCADLFGHQRIKFGSERLKLVALDPELDLALLTWSKPDAKKVQALTPLKMAVGATAEPGEAQTLRRSLVKDKKSRSVSHRELFNHMRTAKAHDASVRLVGGSPFVDGDGRLLGLWRWTPPGEFPKLVSSKEIAELIREFKEEDDVQKSFGEKPWSRVFPALGWSNAKGKRPYDHAQGQARKLRKDLECGRCHGVGRIEEKGKIRKGKDLKDNDYSLPCKTCGQSGLASEIDVWRKMLALAAAACKPDPKQHSPKPMLKSLENYLTEALELAPKKTLRIIRDHASEALDPTKARPGAPVAFLAPEGSWPEEDLGLWTGEVLPIEASTFRVFLIEPEARNVRGESVEALVLGTVAGTIYWDNEPWVVIERAVAVPVITD